MKDFRKSMLPQAFPFKYLVYDPVPTHPIGNTASLLMHAAWAMFDDRSRKFVGLLLEGLYGFDISMWTCIEFLIQERKPNSSCGRCGGIGESGR